MSRSAPNRRRPTVEHSFDFPVENGALHAARDRFFAVGLLRRREPTLPAQAFAELVEIFQAVERLFSELRP